MLTVITDVAPGNLAKSGLQKLLNYECVLQRFCRMGCKTLQMLNQCQEWKAIITSNLEQDNCKLRLLTLSTADTVIDHQNSQGAIIIL